MFKFIFQNIIGIFIGLLPIYWFPGVNHDIFNYVKNIIYVLTCWYLVWNLNFSRNIFPNLKLFILIVIVDFTLLLPSLIQSSSEYYLTVFKEFFIPIMIILITLGLNKGGEYFLDQLRIGIKVFSLFVFIGLILFYVSPLEMTPSELFHGETREVMFIRGSFSGSSTSWGMSCSFYFIIAAILCKLKKLNFIHLFIFFLTVLISVFITGSRSAQLVLVLVFIIYNVTEFRISSVLVIFSIISLILLFIYKNSGFETDSLRILNFQNATFDDDFSSGRSVDFEKSIYQIVNSPFFGSGYRFIEGKSFHTGNVHNTFLRQLVTYGFFFFFVLYIELFCYLYLIFRRLKFHETNNFKSSHLLLILAVGIIPISLVEPFILFGLGLMNLPIWFLFTALYKYGGNEIKVV
jgi:hypothetical protein